jgi:S1-C subfamily serine protease
VTVVDVVVIIVALAAGLRGWRRGLLGQAFELGGGLVGLVAGIALGPRIASALTNSAGLVGALIALVAVLVGLSAGQVIGFVLGHRFATLARRARLGGVDTTLGVLFGVGVILVSYWLLGSVLAHGPLPQLARELRRSSVLRAMNGVARPPDVLAYVNQYLDTSRFPQVFAGLPPELGPSVELPRGGVAKRAFQEAAGSTVRVSTHACGGLQLGSGWVAAPDTVVTNAHVVAGGGTVEIRDGDGASSEGTVVLFEPAVDIAIVRADGVGGAPLALETEELAPGRIGATLGYPGGGQLRAHGAAVQRAIPADGFDIYGRDAVTRDIYELRATVRQGDSGGPFVLGDGSVAGVVFAASTASNRVGYALTGAEVQDEIERGEKATEPVDTQGCTH